MQSCVNFKRTSEQLCLAGFLCDGGISQWKTWRHRQRQHWEQVAQEFIVQLFKVFIVHCISQHSSWRIDFRTSLWADSSETTSGNEDAEIKWFRIKKSLFCVGANQSVTHHLCMLIQVELNPYFSHHLSFEESIAELWVQRPATVVDFLCWTRKLLLLFVYDWHNPNMLKRSPYWSHTFGSCAGLDDVCHDGVQSGSGICFTVLSYLFIRDRITLSCFNTGILLLLYIVMTHKLDTTGI